MAVRIPRQGRDTRMDTKRERLVVEKTAAEIEAVLGFGAVSI